MQANSSERTTLKNNKIYDNAPRQRYIKTTKHSSYVANRIDPSKKPTFLSQIKDEPDELSAFKKHNEGEKPLSSQNNIGSPTTKLQPAKKELVKFTKKQFLQQLEAKHQQQTSYAPNYYQTISSSKKYFRNFLKVMFRPLMFCKRTNKAKRWNK
ncbi:MAG: hypothetical protein EIB84_05835 [Spiroplasma poulsonii]|uniref:Uncharacterized protein n=1 Tax=Spiroplasma poulsonii TaxID=2138 RepID=A0A2P6FDW2_9MOLU|nr:hypothetical protein [Spiroplasma poulsonii]KAF0850633.1 hypothetical protein MSROBK_015170 [Spiroplasma poulsonii]MBW1242291.1 hypothetical protein [Spiroplasma poulsonii]PQM31645.1 hypothetical protein SMSRO_SF014900 [Spiroplasma poulsonii]PWF96669.1 hypothetical protein SMSE_21160 [Spiroplasma poulsonii]PWF97245.1 hypothetical protein SMH99_20540 [Spiroplasma poulsonii]